MRRYVPALSILLIFALVLESIVVPVVAQEADPKAEEEVAPLEWPREVMAGGAEVIMYQPQPETFAGDKLTARAAVSVTRKGETEPVFGAIWLEATVRTDRETRVVELVNVKVGRVRFPDATEEQTKKLAALIERELPKWAPEVSLDRLLTSLDTAEVEAQRAKQLKNDPPKFRFVTEPTELVILSGKPELRPIKDSKIMKVINTIYLVVLDPGTKAYYLNLGKLWMTAPDLLKGPWAKAEKVPAEVQKLTPKPEPDEEPIDESLVPKVIVVEELEELITIDGEPKYSPLPGNELLYMSNTESSIFMDIAQQQYYILAAGRWFTSKSLMKGPWTYAPADKLPAAFGKIPADSDVGDTRSFVAGTDEAKDAVLDAQIPQTAAIKRDDQSLKVAYDGDPTFQGIEEVNHLGYAINTQFAVFRDNRAAKPVFYCCWNGVWYVAQSPLGPWAVATTIADTIYKIPASCPLYNVTYVKIYRVEPTMVYVGYLPGYTGCYVYGGTVVYGTGYYYTPWVGTVYYAAPVTYSVSVRYYPSLGRWFHPLSVGGVVRRTRRRTRRRVNHRNSYHRHHHHHHHNRSNKYNNHKGRSNQSSRNRAQANKSRNQNHNRNTQKNRKNNHYADKKGNVHRQNKSGSYQKKDKSGWSNSNQKKSSSMKRDSQNRSRGSSRSSSYNKSSKSSRSSSSRSRSGGGRSGGGGRRR